MINNLKVLLWLAKNQKRAKDQTAPVYCRITIDGKRAEIATGVRCRINEFDNKNKRISGTGKDVETNNLRLKKMVSQLVDVYTQETLFNENYLKADELKKLYFKDMGKKMRQKHILTLKELVEKHTERMIAEALGEAKRKRIAKTSQTALRAIEKLKIEDFAIDNCTKKTLDDIANALVSTFNYSIDYSRIAVRLVRQALIAAYGEGKTAKCSVLEYRFPFKSSKPKEPVVLSPEDLEKISKLWDFYNPSEDTETSSEAKPENTTLSVVKSVEPESESSHLKVKKNEPETKQTAADEDTKPKKKLITRP